MSLLMASTVTVSAHQEANRFGSGRVGAGNTKNGRSAYDPIADISAAMIKQTRYREAVLGMKREVSKKYLKINAKWRYCQSNRYLAPVGRADLNSASLSV